MASAWLEFLAKFRKSHPKLKGKEVLKAAAVEYRKKKKPADKAKVAPKVKGKEPKKKVKRMKKDEEMVE